MWLPFITKIKKLEEEKRKLWESSVEMIRLCQNFMKEHGEFITNEIGSGENTYDIGGRLFEFNELQRDHHGFYIDGKKVSLTKFIKEAQKSETYLNKLQKLIRSK